ncbi:MAG: inositol monophosphatase [Candidatus Tectimicrobiota bacterium]
MDHALDNYRKIAEDAALAGGRVLLEHRFSPLEISHKERQEVVTNVDHLADAAIAQVLTQAVPEHGILSEESGRQSSASPYTWIVDPLDGTESYIRGQNFSSVTIALTRDEEILVGVVYHPFNDELYSAVAGGQATINGHALQVTQVSTLDQARLILDYSPRDALRQRLHDVEWARGFKQTFRLGGSVALNMCLVARGAAEGYMYGRLRNRLKSWDIAAAALVVQQAGGRVLDRQGQPLATLQPQGFVLCCNAGLEPQMLLQEAAST